MNLFNDAIAGLKEVLMEQITAAVERQMAPELAARGFEAQMQGDTLGGTYDAETGAWTGYFRAGDGVGVNPLGP